MDELSKHSLEISIDVKEYMKIDKDLSIIIHNLKCFEESFLNAHNYTDAHQLRLNRQSLINIKCGIVRTLSDVHAKVVKAGIASLK
jgi:hypothetical protein